MRVCVFVCAHTYVRARERERECTCVCLCGNLHKELSLSLSLSVCVSVCVCCISDQLPRQVLGPDGLIEQPSSSTVAAPHRAHSSSAHRPIKEPFRGRKVPPALYAEKQMTLKFTDARWNYFGDRNKISCLLPPTADFQIWLLFKGMPTWCEIIYYWSRRYVANGSLNVKEPLALSVVAALLAQYAIRLHYVFQLTGLMCK